MNNDFILKRRSIRKYKDTPVEKEKVKSLLEAAMAAPSAVNCQPWEFIVIDDPKRLESIREHMIFARYQAPLAIIVCGNMELALKGPDKDMWIMDCSAAIENMLILAPQMELGSVWIGIYPVSGRVDKIRELFSIPSHVIPMSIIYFGYPDEVKEPRTRYNEKAVHYQEYENRKMRTKDKPKKGHY